MQAASTQRLMDHRGAATAALAIAIFISGLALGASLATNVGRIADGASVHAPAFDPNAVSLQQARRIETGHGASSRAAFPSFDVAHHLRAAPPLPGEAAINAVRDQRRGEFGVGGP